MKLQKILILEGILETVTGLRIGGSKEEIEIGGIDNVVIRHPITRFPYIPGSSLKGKVRSLLEWAHWDQCKIETKDGKTPECKCGNCKVCLLFGSLGENQQVTRVLFRDAFVEGMNVSPNMKEWHKCSHDGCTEKNPLCSFRVLEKLKQDRGLEYVEVKVETAIDRLKGKARDRSLRTGERVPPGIRFPFQVILRVFENDQDLLPLLKEGLNLLQNDALGGSGSRGYGVVKLDYMVKEAPVFQEAAS